MKNEQIYELIFSTLFSVRRSGNVHLPSESVLTDLITSAKEKLEKEEFCVILKGKWVIVGDIHGDIASLIRIFSTMGYPPETHYLFLGDYVDRGKYSIEVMTLLLSLKVLFSDSIYLIRGNHETRNVSMSYGFYEECCSKMTESIYDEFVSLFDELPLVALINGRIFCSHGGISKKANDFLKLFNFSKPKSSDKPKKQQIVHDLLWSDPSNSTDFFERNDRGGKTFVFGEKALDSFLKENGFTCVIRGHQSCMNGYDKPFGNDKCWTFFSSVNYCETWNYGAVLEVEEDDNVEVVAFEPINEDENKHQKIILPEWLIDSEEPIYIGNEQPVYFDSLLDDETSDLLADYVSL